MNEITGNNLTLYSKFKVTSADTDMEARIRLGSLINLLIQSAIQSADSLGFGFGGIRQEKLYWVLSRITIEIYRPLIWYNEVEVETWPKDIESILYLRDFLVRDKEQNIVAKATSGWLAIDLETKRPKKIEGILREIFFHLKDKHALEQSPEKLSPVKEGDHFEIIPSYFDIDLNKHVTATRYIDWMMDTFPADFLRSHYPKRLSVNYMKETMPGEKILILRNHPDKLQFHFEGSNSSNNTNAFRGKVDF